MPRIELAAGVTSVAVSVLLMGLKFLAYYLTGSSAVFSDALESIVNVAASSFAMYSLWLAHQPPDRQHPYGHGKVEFLSAGLEGGMILLASMVIAFQAIETLIRGPHVEQLDWGLGLITAAGVVNGLVGLYLVRLGRRRSALTLEADGQHLMSDAVTSVAVIVALGLVWVTGWQVLDPLAALLVAGYIAWTAIGLLRQSSAGLMDQQDAGDEQLLQQILDSHIGPDGTPPRICSYHKLRHRHSGRYHWIDFHIMVPPHWNVREGHTVASAIEYEIEMALGGNATAHVEPCQDEACRNCDGIPPPAGSNASA